MRENDLSVVVVVVVVRKLALEKGRRCAIGRWGQPELRSSCEVKKEKHESLGGYDALKRSAGFVKLGEDAVLNEGTVRSSC